MDNAALLLPLDIIQPSIEVKNQQSVMFTNQVVNGGVYVSVVQARRIYADR